MFGSYQEVKKAIFNSSGTFLNSLNDDGLTPVGAASSFANLESVIALTEAGADLNLFDVDRGGEPPISAALIAKSVEVVRYLLKAKVNLNLKGWMGIDSQFRLVEFLQDPEIGHRHQVTLE